MFTSNARIANFQFSIFNFQFSIFNSLLFSLLLTISLSSPTTAQSLIPLSGTHRLPRPSVPYRPAAKQQPSPAFQIGDSLTLPAYSFQIAGGGHYQTTTTCRFVGEHCYIFVEDDVWGTSRVTQTGIESLAHAFDTTTNRHPDRGIYTVDTDLFGSPPDVDGDPRILLVVLDILDSPITGVTFVGYFDVENQIPPVSREILYIDSNPLDLNSNLARATIAHEFQHMLHWRVDPNEDKWLDEGCSEYAELACGYKDTTAAATELFLSLALNTSLTDWEDLSFDFDQAYLWMTYFVQRYGESALQSITADTTNGITSINRFLDSRDRPERFDHIFGMWSAAMYLDGPDDLGYRDIALGPVKSDAIAVPTTNLARTASLWGIDYLSISPTSPIALTVHPNGNNDLLITLIASGDQPFAAPITIPSGQTRRIHTSALNALALTTTSGSVYGYTLSVAPLAEGPATADFDASGDVGFADFLTFASGFGKIAGNPGFDPTFDLDGDHRVAFSDFLIFARHFGAKL